jgi:heparan-alpha-glucosaminide N-acetyltransferase
MQATITTPVAVAPEMKVPAAQPQRHLALDAYRGFIMVVLASAGFGLAGLAKRNPAFAPLADQFEHHDWEWIAFWDLIQPAFMFMVGVAMPFALAIRRARGATEGELFRHVAIRSLRLLLMSQILISIGRGKLGFQIINVLAQIAITYFLCYLIMKLQFKWQAAIAAGLLIGHWALFVAFPGTEGPFLSKTTNIGARIDLFVFGKINNGYWANINFITSTATTLFGVWTGQLLQSRRTHAEKMKQLALWAGVCLAVGLAISPWNPIIKRICTTSFTIYSTGWVLAMLLFFYWVVEVKGYRKWTFPLVVVGANSIFIYSLEQVLRGWLNRAVGVFTFNYEWLGQFAPVAQSCTVLLVMYGMCLWLYRRKIFFKL